MCTIIYECYSHINVNNMHSKLAGKCVSYEQETTMFHEMVLWKGEHWKEINLDMLEPIQHALPPRHQRNDLKGFQSLRFE